MIHKGDYFAQFNEDLPEGYDILQVGDILGNSIEAEGITIGPSDLRVRQWPISREIGLRYWTPIAPEDADCLFELFRSTFESVENIVLNAQHHEYDQFQVGNCYSCKIQDHIVIYNVTECRGNIKYYKTAFMNSGCLMLDGPIRINKLEVTHDLVPIHPSTFIKIEKSMNTMASSVRPIVQKKYGLCP